MAVNKAFEKFHKVVLRLQEDSGNQKTWDSLLKGASALLRYYAKHEELLVTLSPMEQIQAQEDVTFLLMQSYSLDEEDRGIIEDLAAVCLPFSSYSILRSFRGRDGLSIALMIKDATLNGVERFALAKLVAQEHPKAVSWNIDSFKLNQMQRGKVARIAAEKDREAVKKLIGNYYLRRSQIKSIFGE